jgi:hypothetical protein
MLEMKTGITNGTCLQGYFPEPTKYTDLVKAFGKPNAEGDFYKTDAEWTGIINGRVFSIYNYKDGKNYNGEAGQETEDITCWHIGGTNKRVVVDLIDYLKEKLNESR